MEKYLQFATTSFKPTIVPESIFGKPCTRIPMLYGSETWCFRENEVTSLRRTERAMARAMCGTN